MANNQYVNKVELGDQTIIDISDTTATAADVVSGKKLYTASGESVNGSLVPGTITEVQANGTSVATSGVANIPAASTSQYGVTKLNNTLSSTSTTEAATASAARELNQAITDLDNKITTFSNGWASVSSGFSGQVSNDSIKFVKRDDGVCMVYGEFNVSSDISPAARAPIFERLPRTSFAYPANTVWVSAINSSTNKSYRIAFNPSNGTLDEFYAAIPSGNYQLNAFTYFT